MNKYYVYIYYDPREGKSTVPFYIGKGTKKILDENYKRAYSHLNKGGFSPPMKRVLNKIAEQELTPIIRIYRTFDKEENAYNCEKFLIKKIGCRWNNTGPLLNLKEGGEGGSYRFTAEQYNRVVKHLCELNKDPAIRIASGLRMKKQLQDLEFVAKQSQSVSQASTKNWANPVWKENQIFLMKEAAARPEVQENRIKVAEECWAKRSVEYKKKHHIKMIAAKTNSNLTICGVKYTTLSCAAKGFNVEVEAVVAQRNLEKIFFKKLKKQGIDIVAYNALVGKTLVAAGFIKFNTNVESK